MSNDLHEHDEDAMFGDSHINNNNNPNDTNNINSNTNNNIDTLFFSIQESPQHFNININTKITPTFTRNKFKTILSVLYNLSNLNDIYMPITIRINTNVKNQNQFAFICKYENQLHATSVHDKLVSKNNNKIAVSKMKKKVMFGYIKPIHEHLLLENINNTFIQEVPSIKLSYKFITINNKKERDNALYFSCLHEHLDKLYKIKINEKYLHVYTMVKGTRVCTKCWKVNHTAQMCNSTMYKCIYCHEFHQHLSECDKKQQIISSNSYKCVLCQHDHLSFKCSTFKTQYELYDPEQHFIKLQVTSYKFTVTQ